MDNLYVITRGTNTDLYIFPGCGLGGVWSIPFLPPFQVLQLMMFYFIDCLVA